VTLIPWSRGRCLTWDVTIPDTLAASHLDRTSLDAGAATEHAAAAQKIFKHAEIIYIYDFVPIAVETLGSWSSDVLTFVKQLGKRISKNTGDNQETAFLLPFSAAIKYVLVVVLRDIVYNLFCIDLFNMTIGTSVIKPVIAGMGTGGQT